MGRHRAQTLVAARTAATSTLVPPTPWTRGNRLLGYDPELRRLWLGGRRLHHGVTGIALAGAGLMRLAARGPRVRGIGWALAGGALIAHDWKDRAAWFGRGSQA